MESGGEVESVVESVVRRVERASDGGDEDENDEASGNGHPDEAGKSAGQKDDVERVPSFGEKVVLSGDDDEEEIASCVAT